MLCSVEYTLEPFAPISGFILPSAAGPLLDDAAKFPIDVKFATAITFLACLWPPVTFPQFAPEVPEIYGLVQEELPLFPAEKTCIKWVKELLCSSISLAKDVYPALQPLLYDVDVTTTS